MTYFLRRYFSYLPGLVPCLAIVVLLVLWQMKSDPLFIAHGTDTAVYLGQKDRPETEALSTTPRNTSVVALSASSEVAANTLTEAERASGWRLLFDGETFGQWRNYGATGAVKKWVIEDGALKLPGTTLGYLQTLSNWVFGTASGDLIYAGQKFQNFELSLQWKISENGNSGIFYLVADEKHGVAWLTGLEMQVLHNEGHPDGKIAKHRAGDLYDMIAAVPETVLPPGHWNEVLIRIQDNEVEHWLNGTRVVSYTYGGERWDAMVAASKFKDMPEYGKADAGYIVLQDHGDRVWYRNIKVREF